MEFNLPAFSIKKTRKVARRTCCACKAPKPKDKEEGRKKSEISYKIAKKEKELLTNLFAILWMDKWNMPTQGRIKRTCIQH